MTGLSQRFALLVALVSALLLLSGWLVIEGVGGGHGLLVVAGALVGGVGLLGLVSLARMVVVVERSRGGR